MAAARTEKQGEGAAGVKPAPWGDHLHTISHQEPKQNHLEDNNFHNKPAPYGYEVGGIV